MSHAPAAAPDVAAVVRAVADFAGARGRDDEAARLQAAAARCARPTTIVCVVGEFKQGKSSLINALLGTAACPVDDDLATSALTLIGHGDRYRIEVRRSDGESMSMETLDPADLTDWATEQGNRDNHRRVERIEISLPSPLLAEGLALVDTPGVGGLAAGYARATLAFLPYADALIFVSDASAELSGPELEFVAQGAERCPVIVHALTKIDLYPAWRRIEALNQGHLRSAGLNVSTVPISAALRAAGLARVDPDLNERSGVPALLRLLRADVLGPARARATVRAAVETSAVLDLLESAAREERAMLNNPDRLVEAAHRIEAAQARLDHLRGPGSRWATVVADRVADVSSDVTFRFRAAIRDLLRDADQRVEGLKTPSDLAELAAHLQAEISGVVSEAFAAVDQGRSSIHGEVAALLAEEDLPFPPLAAGRSVDLGALWRQPAMPAVGGIGRVAGTAMASFRSAQGGILMFGMLGRFAPAGLAAVMMSNPVTIGIGAAFAGVGLLDAHRRKVATFRQGARTTIRQFLDDVQFEVGNELAQAVRDMQRSLRDEFGRTIEGLVRHYAGLAAQARQASESDAARTAARSTELDADLARIARARELLREAGTR